MICRFEPPTPKFRNRLAVFVAAGLALFSWSFAPATAHADDWEVRSDGDDRDQQIVERYRQMLEENPVEGMALDRLLGHVGRGAGLDRLIEQYEQRVEASGRRANLRLVLGHLYKARGDYEEALDQYDEAVELDPDDSIGWLSRGTAKLLLGDRRAASEDFEEALERETSGERRREILQDLGELSFSEREFERGKEYFQRLIQRAPNDQYVRMDYVQLLVQYRQLEEAIEQYEQLRRFVEGDPRQFANLLRDKADVYEMMGRIDEALDTYEEAMQKVRSDSWIAREIRGRIVGVYRQGGRLEEFLDEYGGSWSRGDSEQRMQIADVYAEMGRLEEALERYRTLARGGHAPIEGREKAIRILERLGRDDEIADAYRELMNRASDRPEYGFELAEHYMRLGDRSATEGVLRQMERRFSNNSYVLLDIADAYARWHFTDGAERLYEEVLRREGDDDAVLIDVGDFFFQRGRRGRAIEIWSRLPESILGHREGTRRMAELFIERGVTERGITAYEELLEEHPQDERLLRSLARALERAGRYGEALQRWERFLEVTDSDRSRREARARIVEIYDRRRQLHVQTQRWEEAFSEQTGEESLQAGLFLVEAHLQQRDYDSAEEVLDELRNRPLEGEAEITALRLLEQTLVRTGRYEEAIEVIERLVELQPQQRDQLMERQADYAIDARDGDRAVDFASRALESNPDSARAHRKLGEVYRTLGDPQAAADHFRTAVDIDPGAHDVQLELGEVLVELERFSEAQEALMEVVEDATESQLVREAGQRLLQLAADRDRLEALETEWMPLVFRMPIRQEHARLMFDLYDAMAGPRLMEAYHGDWNRRRQAEQALYEMGGRAATLMVQQLQRDDAASRVRALRMVAEMEVDVASAQVARLIASDDEELRKMAIVTAARLGGGEFVEPLEGALSAGSASVRHLAVWALGYIDTPEARQVLMQRADGAVDGTGPRLALLGLRPADDEEHLQLLEAELNRMIDAAQTVDRTRVAIAMMQAAEAIEETGAEPLREPLERLATERGDRIGQWAAVTLAHYGDEASASVLWELVLDGDDRRARHGEAALSRQLGSAVEARRSWRIEARHFDWIRGDFDARALLSDVERRWAGGADGEQQAWSESVERGLRTALDGREFSDLERVFARMGRQLSNEQTAAFWTGERTQSFARVAVESADADQWEETTRLGLDILRNGTDLASAGSAEQIAASEVLFTLALHVADDGETVQALIGEALDGADPGVRRRALGGLRIVGDTERMRTAVGDRVIEALGDDDPSVQIAAVRAAGRLGLDDSRPILVELEQEARPALRRAVREAMRSLD